MILSYAVLARDKSVIKNLKLKILFNSNRNDDVGRNIS